MLTNHAPIISILKGGNVTINGEVTLEEEVADKFTKQDGKTLLSINSGTIELKDNKLIILAD